MHELDNCKGGSSVFIRVFVATLRPASLQEVRSSEIIR